ncbi:hypothetical protein PIB30_054565 [Stylosanthes scabra]|uniref:RRM domain-containing protein n=1 Tax=Stylosanthes scabra TaxID=79078 RepID=A0ABU6TJQ8_9FABA|nr:hypothetical protein [Stylosanthes scabra]
MREGREKKSVREGEAKGQWRVVVRRKPNSHWRQGPTHAYQGPPNRKTDRQESTGKEVEEHRWVENNTFSVFADNLPPNTTYQWLWKVFNSIGKVEDIYLSKKIKSGNPLKFAFVRYRTREEMRRKIEHLDDGLFGGVDLESRSPDIEGTIKQSKRIPEADMNPIR